MMPATGSGTSLRLRTSRINIPRSAEVTITEPGFFMPRIVVQLCDASSTTATPCGFRFVIRKSAIWLVSRSWS